MSTATDEAARVMRAVLAANHYRYGEPEAFLRGFLLGSLEAILRGIPGLTDRERIARASVLLDAYHEVREELR